MTKLIFRAANGDAQDVVLPELGATIGRSPDNTVPIDEPSVSGHHGSIRFEHGEWWVRDNGSSNGTCVNDVEVKESVLKDGDRLRFGSIECVFASAPELPVPVADFAVPAAPVADFAVPAAPVADFAVPAAPVVPEAVAAESNPVQPVVAEPAVAPVAAMAAAAPPVEAHAKPELKLPPKPALKPGWKLPGKTPVAAKAPEASASAKVPETPAPAKAAEPTVPAKAKDRAEAKSAAPEWKPPVLEVVKDAALPPMADDDVALIAELKNRYLQIKEQLANVVIGQTSVVEEVLVAVFSRGHALLVGVPGLAKTLLISTLARVLDLGFKRVQFTPDLMP